MNEQIERIDRGEDPLGVVRDPAKNEPWIDLPREKEIGFAFPGARVSAHDVMPDVPIGSRARQG